MYTFGIDQPPTTSGSQSRTFTLTVDQLPSITTTSTTFTVGTTNSFQIPTTGYPTPTFTDTNLPAGLNLTTSGLLTGLPTAGDGVYTFGVTATNSVGSDPETFTLTVDQLPSITTTSTTFTVGTTNSFQILATGYATPTFTDTNLPAGLNLTSSGLLTGLPTAGDGVYTFGVTATNSVGADTETFTLPSISFRASPPRPRRSRSEPPTRSRYRRPAMRRRPSPTPIAGGIEPDFQWSAHRPADGGRWRVHLRRHRHQQRRLRYRDVHAHRRSGSGDHHHVHDVHGRDHNSFQIPATGYRRRPSPTPICRRD